MRRQYPSGESPQFRQNVYSLTRSSHSVSQPRLTTNSSNRSLINLLGSKHTNYEVKHTQSQHQSVFASVEVDKENEVPNYEENLAVSRPISQIDKFRKERIQKLYGLQRSTDDKKRPVAQSSHQLDQMIASKEATISEQTQTIRRLQQQLRQRDRMILELQKADHNKENHLVSLTSNNFTLTSTVELLKQQTSHMASTNQRLQSEATALKKLAQKQSEELALVKDQLSKKAKSIEMFGNLEPRLRELEVLQDQLITENTVLKVQNRNLQDLRKYPQQTELFDLQILN